MEKDAVRKEEIKAKLVAEVVPTFYGRLEKIHTNNAGSKWLVGQSPTWADAWIYNVMERYQETLQGHDLVEAFPNLQLSRDSFAQLPQIKAYLANRPVLK
jgi:glutathione S-transferase